jgi:hypothetical protein
LDHCDVHDLGFTGVPWTFDNKQWGDRIVRVRLDRAVASLSWSDWFKDAHVRHLVTSRFDHLPILLELEHNRGPGRQNRIAHYEIMWEREESLPDEIRRAWEAGAPVQTLGDVAGKLSGVMSSLRSWSKVNFGAVTSELEKIRAKMEELSRQDPELG